MSSNQSQASSPVLARCTQTLLCVNAVSNLVFIRIWTSLWERGSVIGGEAVAVPVHHLYWYYPIQWITAALVLAWTYHANLGARRLGAADMSFTPWGVVGFYCVPVLWFWMPLQATREIWRASSNPSRWRSEPVSPLLNLWWALWVLAFSAWIADEIMMPPNKEAFMGWAGVVSLSAEVPAALLLLLIIHEVQAVQMEQAETA